MTFRKLSVFQNNYTINNRISYLPIVDLNKYVPEVFDFAYGMTFGNSGHHRPHRTGGQYGRRNGELFINAFQGKLAEFGIWQLFSTNGIDTPKPDLEKWGEGKWDDNDLKIKGHHVSVKSTSSKGNLLLLETDDWDSEGRYIPNSGTNNEYVDFHLFCRIDPDGKSLIREKKWMYVDEIDKNDLFNLIKNVNWSMDCPGYITKDDLKYLIANVFVLPQNSTLHTYTKMDASNYYCQAGDLRPLVELFENLKA
jgi:hypothetical protein